MPIIVNGGENPQAVQFNSSSMGAVYFAPTRNDDFIQVWGSDGGNYPLSITQIRAYNSPVYGQDKKSGSYDMYLNNLTFKRTWVRLTPSTGYMKRYYEYETQNASFDFDWPSNQFSGYIFPPNDVTAMQEILEGTAATVSGIPSMFSGYDVGVLPDITWAFDYTYRNVEQTLSGRTTVTQKIESVSIDADSNNIIFMNPVSTPLIVDDTVWCYTASTGLVTNGTAKVQFSVQI